MITCYITFTLNPYKITKKVTKTKFFSSNDIWSNIVRRLDKKKSFFPFSLQFIFYRFTKLQIFLIFHYFIFNTMFFNKIINVHIVFLFKWKFKFTWFFIIQINEFFKIVKILTRIIFLSFSNALFGKLIFTFLNFEFIEWFKIRSTFYS